MVEAHNLGRGERHAAAEALLSEPLPHKVGKLSAPVVMPEAKLGAAPVQLREEQLNGPSTCSVFLHLRGGALHVVRSVHRELLAESALELVAELKLYHFPRVDVAELPEAGVPAWTSMRSDTVVRET
jgi:hypothetical protein